MLFNFYLLGLSVFTKPEYQVRVKLILRPSFTWVFATQVQTLGIILPFDPKLKLFEVR